MPRRRKNTTPPPRRNSPRTPNQDSPDRKKKKTDNPMGQKRKDLNNTDTNDEDGMSVDTPKGNNKSETSITTQFPSFLYFRFKVRALKKGSKTMRTKIQELLKIMQVSDPDVCLLHYKLDLDMDNDGNILPISEKFVVENSEDIPESITGMSNILWGPPKF